MKSLLHILCIVLVLSAADPAAAARAADTEDAIARGRYMVQIGGCNDCHTAGYAMSGGRTPESEWLKGDMVGYSGPWGTTYPANLRQYLGRMSEQQWLDTAHRLEARPPMPAVSIRAMSEADLRAIYRFTRSLGDSDSPVPAYLPPGIAAPQPVVQFPSAP